MDANKSWSLGFEFVDIEIIDHKNETEKEKPVEKFKCDQCSLFFLNKEKLVLHQKKHVTESEESVKCRYCNKTLSITEESKESYNNRKCETCEYRCSKCPQRFLRHSSLLNHEKNHKLPRKKQVSLFNRKRVNGLKTPNNIENRVSKRGRPRKYPVISSDATSKEKENSELGISQKKKQKIQSESPVCGDNEVSPKIKTPKRSSVRAGKSSEGGMSSPAVSSSPLSTQISENGVNYKPFSCHVCGDHFVTDNVLLEHIQTHGDVSEGFKCKHCDEEFVDIYKMQFHLAICPFAEDELETSIKKNSLPPQFLAKPPVTASEMPRKRGRPRKIKPDMPQNSEEVYKPLTTTAKGYSKKRKTDDPAEFVIKTPRALRTSLPAPVRRNSRSKSLLTDSGSGINEQGESNSEDNIDDDDTEGLMVDDDLNTSTKNDDSGLEDKKKEHACPFPRCHFTFTREKALLCHMRNHNDDFDEALKCHKCDIPFDDLRSLRKHIDDCKGIKEEKDDDFEEPEGPDMEDQTEGTFHTFQRSKGSFMCKVCGRAYNSAAKLKRHEVLHCSPSFECRICKGVFVNQLLLDQHFSIRHPNKSPYHCGKCNEDFISELFLQIHHTDYHSETKLTESAVEDERNENIQSESVSVRLKILKRNNYSSTLVNNRFSNRSKSQLWCPVCVECFDKRENLRFHLLNNHMSKTDSVYICELCEAEKPNAEMLCSHLEVHSSNLLSVNRFSRLRAYANNPEGSVNGCEEANPASEGVKLHKSKIKITRCTRTNVRNTGFELQCKQVKSRILRRKRNAFQRNKMLKPKDVEQKQKDEEKTTENCSNKISLPFNIPSCSDEVQIKPVGRINYESKADGSAREKPSKRVVRLRKPLHPKRRKPLENSVDLTVSTDLSKVEVIQEKHSTIKSFQEMGDRKRNEETEQKIMPNTTNVKNNPRYTPKRRNSRINTSLINVEEKPQFNERRENLSENSICETSGNREKAIVASDKRVYSENEYQLYTDGNINLDEAKAPQAYIKLSTSSSDSEEMCCSLCSEVFYTQDDLLNHVGTHI